MKTHSGEITLATGLIAGMVLLLGNPFNAWGQRYTAPAHASPVAAASGSVSSSVNHRGGSSNYFTPASPYGDYRSLPPGHTDFRTANTNPMFDGRGPAPIANQFHQCGGPDEAYDDGGGDCSELFVDSAGAGCCPPSCWSLSAGTIFLKRQAFKSQAFTNGPTPTNAKSLVSDYQFGEQASLIYHGLGGSPFDLEASFFSVENFASDTMTLAATQLLSNPPVNFASMDVTSSYDSRVMNGELNLRQQWSDRFTALAGFRYFNVRDDLLHKICDTGMTQRIRTDNQAYGFQVGAETLLLSVSPFELRGWGRFGVMGNFSDQETTSTVIPGVLPAYSHRDNGLGLVSDAGLTACYRINCWLSLRGGYQVLWFDGAATAPAQMISTNNVTGGGNLDRDSTLFFHGGFAGAQLDW